MKEYLRYNRELLKILFKTYGKNTGSHYRFYMIAVRHYYKCSGIFTLDQFMDLLYDRYEFKSLHHGTQNNRSKYRKKLSKLFNDSVLFEKLIDGRFKYVAERKIAPIGKFTTLHHCPESDLMSKQLFNSAIIAVAAANGNRKSYKQLHDQTGFDISYIRKALNSEYIKKRFIKVNNIVVPEMKGQGDPRAIAVLQKQFADIDKINTLRFSYRGSWYLGLYIQNSYFAKVDSKGVEKIAYRTIGKGCKRYQIEVSNAADNLHIWKFKREEYTEENYFSDYSVIQNPSWYDAGRYIARAV